MFESLKKGFAQGKAEAAEQERKRKIAKYVAEEKKSIAQRKKQIAAKPSQTTVALGKIAYHADKYAEKAGVVTGKIASGGKKVLAKIPEPPKSSGTGKSSGGVDKPYRVNNFVLGRSEPDMEPAMTKMPKPPKPKQSKQVVEIRHVYQAEVKQAKEPRQKKGPAHPWLMGRNK